MIPITDDNGQAIKKQYRVIKQKYNWFLLYDQHQTGDCVTHEFRIQKLVHDIRLYPGITLEEALIRFDSLIDNDYE